MTTQLSNLTTVDHPLVQHMITTVRNQETPPHQFRGTVRKIAELLGYEAMRDLPTQLNSVTTPLGAFDLPLLSDANICFVSILRAGNGLWMACSIYILRPLLVTLGSVAMKKH